MPLRDKDAHRAYCRAYYYAHSGKDRERRPRLTREESLARKRARSVEYRLKNKDKIRAYKARPDVRARHTAHNKAWREKHLEYMREYLRKWQRANVEYCQIAGFTYRQKRKARMEVDAEFYASVRRKRREQNRRKREAAGLPYTPRPSMRIPDWCCRGGVLDVRSPWLWENATDEQKAYARELFFERRERLAR